MARADDEAPADDRITWVRPAPATGKIVAELLTGQPPHVDPAHYRPTRF